jgi:IMP dehydrogenase
MIKKYDYNQITLVSDKISEIKNRSECDTSSCLSTILECDIPIINAPMVDVADCHSVSEVSKSGGIGLLHRFGPLENRIAEYISCTYAQYKCSSIGVSIGIGDGHKEEFIKFLDHGANLFCVDVANSSSYRVKESVLALIKIHPYARFIVGNSMSKNGVDFWDDVPQVVAVRCGTSGGLGCTTKNATGMYHPMASLIEDCSKNKPKIIIADGGIREPQDFCKAICLGADLVMIGSVFAACKDSPAKNEGDFKVYKGSASYENQKLYKESPRYIEGKVVKIPNSGLTVAETMVKYKEGLQSSMSYSNAKNLKDYRLFTKVFTT